MILQSVCRPPWCFYTLTKIWIHGLTHWGRVTHICVGNLIIIGSDNVFSPGRGQAIIWINYGILLSGSLRINFNEILIQMYIFSFMKIPLKMLSAKCRPFCLGLNVLIFPVYTNILLGCKAGMAVVVIDLLNPQFVCFCINRFAWVLHVRSREQIYCLPYRYESGLSYMCLVYGSKSNSHP